MTLGVRQTIANAFLSKIEQGYLDNPYHNKAHAADVTHSVHFLLEHLRLRDDLAVHLYFATLVGAVVHDFKHPGRNNTFLAAVSDDEAIRFSDDSVNERMHLAEVFKVRLEVTTTLSILLSLLYEYSSFVRFLFFCLLTILSCSFF